MMHRVLLLALLVTSVFAEEQVFRSKFCHEILGLSSIDRQCEPAASVLLREDGSRYGLAGQLFCCLGMVPSVYEISDADRAVYEGKVNSDLIGVIQAIREDKLFTKLLHYLGTCVHKLPPGRQLQEKDFTEGYLKSDGVRCFA